MDGDSNLMSNTVHVIHTYQFLMQRIKAELLLINKAVKYHETIRAHVRNFLASSSRYVGLRAIGTTATIIFHLCQYIPDQSRRRKCFRSFQEHIFLTYGAFQFVYITVLFMHTKGAVNTTNKYSHHQMRSACIVFSLIHIKYIRIK